MATNISDLATITLITAVPGSGKSLRLCQFIEEAIEQKELVYICNIEGLKLPYIKWSDPTKWQDLPEGAVLVVGECQDFFPTRRSGDEPEYVRAMSRMRHYSIRLVLATQRPEYVDAYVRRLVGLHEHLERGDGKESAKIYRLHKLIPNVDSTKNLHNSGADTETWSYPKHLYGMYQSAPVHTVKRVMKSRVKRALLAGAVVLAIVGFIGYRLFRGTSEAISETVEQASAIAPNFMPSARNSGKAGYADDADYLKQHAPRIRALPYSAPVFDDRQAESDPQIICMSSSAGIRGDGQYHPASCTCLTEQGTRYDLEEQQCRHIARYGPPYNPYKRDKSEHEMLQTKGTDNPSKSQELTIVASPGQVAPYLHSTPTQ
ncbi:MAG: zonular occludens toxin domain-containing protein [Pseudomonadota bacterium]|nr:zonular occludens toxin domain-containing protein [Pseudomonadota bacterium]